IGATRTIDLRESLVNGWFSEFSLSRKRDDDRNGSTRFCPGSYPSEVIAGLPAAWVGVQVPHHNSDRHFSSRRRIFRKRCIHKSRSSPFQWPATLDGIFRTLSSSPGPYNSLTNMDVNQVWAAELRHI